MEDGFYDEDGNMNNELPVSTGAMVFTNNSNGCLVEFKMIYIIEEQLKTLVEIGFEQGIIACIEQLKKIISI